MAEGNQRMNTPAQVVYSNIQTEVNRAKMPVFKLIVFGILAGMFIALGAAGSSVAMHNVSNVGLSRLLGGLVFPVGLMMIVFIGGELFTGDCLLILGVMDKKVRVLSMIKVLVIVWLSNLVGAVIIAALAYFSGQFNYTDGLLGAFTIKVAYGKATMSFGQAFSSGILCNIFVTVIVPSYPVFPLKSPLFINFSIVTDLHPPSDTGKESPDPVTSPFINVFFISINL